MNPLLSLRRCGQSVWLDDIHRKLLTSGEISRLVEEDGLRGITSNPTIFEKAIDAGHDYDEAIRSIVAGNPNISTAALYEELAFEDLRAAADALRPVYEDAEGADGFVSIEVSPKYADDTNKTMAEVKRLAAALDRPNVLVKIPATKAGIPAIEAMLSQGYRINITLMFSMAHYEAVANAYLSALDRIEKKSHESVDPASAERPIDLASMSSVASFFVSRVDTKVDRALEAIGTPEALSLRGKIGVANSKVVYARFRELFDSDHFATLKRLGARPQRVLWASTSPKNPAYPDVLYVEALVGSSTVNTMPLGTLRAFRDHGRVRCTALEEGLEEARDDLARLAGLGVDLGALGEELQREGVASFAASHDKLLASLDQKVRTLVGRAA
jgi:transaldolase